MKIGDVVRNTMAVHSNPAVPGEPVEAGQLGIVVDIRQTDLNACFRPSGKGDVYVDVMLSHEGREVWCGNYMQGFFEVVS